MLVNYFKSLCSRYVGCRLNERTWPVDNESELLSRNLAESSLLLFAAVVVSVLVPVPCLENSSPPGTSSTTMKEYEFLSVGNQTVSVSPASCTAVSRPSDSNKTESVNRKYKFGIWTNKTISLRLDRRWMASWDNYPVTTPGTRRTSLQASFTGVLRDARSQNFRFQSISPPPFAAQEDHKQ